MLGSLVPLQAASSKINWTTGFGGLHAPRAQQVRVRNASNDSIRRTRTAAALATVGSVGGTAAAEQIRSPVSQPGFAEQLKITGPLADDDVAASSPPAASGGGRAHRALSQYEYASVHHYQSARRRLLDLDPKRRRSPAPRGDAV